MSKKPTKQMADKQIVISFVACLFGIFWLSILLEPLAFAFAKKYSKYCSDDKATLATITMVISGIAMAIMALAIITALA